MAEFFGHLEDPQGLAVALGIHLAEIAVQAFAGGAALLLSDHGDGPALVEGEPGDERLSSAKRGAPWIFGESVIRAPI